MNVQSTSRLHLMAPRAHAEANTPESNDIARNPDHAFAGLLDQKTAASIGSTTGTSSSSGQQNGTAQDSGAAPGVMNTSKVGFNALVGQDVNPPQVQSSPAATPSIDAPNAYDDAYWAKQPAAVQQLRNIADPNQRMAQAATLASEGYQIDVPIMAWGWDAQKTMALRSSFGYTWVPSALQTPVTAAPGITGPGITPYDPNHPPAGAITLTA